MLKADTSKESSGGHTDLVNIWERLKNIFFNSLIFLANVSSILFASVRITISLQRISCEMNKRVPSPKLFLVKFEWLSQLFNKKVDWIKTEE